MPGRISWSRCAVCALILLLGLVIDVQAGWQIETVDSDGGGEYASLLLVNDVPHIAYTNPVQARYARYDTVSQSWVTEVLHPGQASYTHTSLTFLNGVPHVGLCNSSGGMLMAARNGMGIPENEDWEWTSVDGSIDTYSNLRADSSGNLHACGYDADQRRLRYAYYPAGGTAWTNQTIDNNGDVGGGCSMALDGTTPHISYRDDTNGALKYASYQPGITPPYLWDKETVPGTDNLAGYTSIAVDNDNEIHASFHERGGDGHKIRYATGEFGAWSTEDATWNDTGWYNSIAVDEDDRPHIAEFLNGMLYLNWRDADGDWHWEIVDDGIRPDNPHSVGSYCSIALDSQGRPHIAYWDDTSGSLVYAVRDTAVPEPGTLSLLALGGLAILRRRREG